MADIGKLRTQVYAMLIIGPGGLAESGGIAGIVCAGEIAAEGYEVNILHGRIAHTENRSPSPSRIFRGSHFAEQRQIADGILEIESARKLAFPAKIICIVIIVAYMKRVFRKIFKCRKTKAQAVVAICEIEAGYVLKSGIRTAA